MKITGERSKEIANGLKMIVEACNSFTEEELSELLRIGDMKHELDPMLNPTRYRLEGEGISQTQKVLRALITFKREVKGIGNFS